MAKKYDVKKANRTTAKWMGIFCLSIPIIGTTMYIIFR